MIYVALGALVLLFLVGFRHHPLVRLAHGRLGAGMLGAAAAAMALLAAIRGSWLGGSLLLTAAVWLAAGARRPAPGPEPMDLAQARAVLGVPAGAGRAEIEAAYRRLIQRVHPDKGGAPGLAAQLNAARDRLLGAGG